METTTSRIAIAGLAPSFMTLSNWRILWVIYAIAWTVALQVPVPIDTRARPEWEMPVFTFSKCVHIAAFSLFVILGARMRLPGSARWLLLAFFFCHAMLTEYCQYLLEAYCHRHGQWSDVGLDSIGIVIGVALTWRYWFKPV